MASKEGPERFYHRVLEDETLQDILVRAANREKPGTPSKGGQFTREQRQWARSLVKRKLWRHVRDEDKVLLQGDGRPGLSYLSEALRSVVGETAAANVAVDSSAATGASADQLGHVRRSTAEAAASSSSSRRTDTGKAKSAASAKAKSGVPIVEALDLKALAAAKKMAASAVGQKLKALADQALTLCVTKEDAEAVARDLLKRLDLAFPGVAQQVQTAQTDCKCRPLLEALGSMRKSWRHNNEPVCRALDRCVRVAGFGKRRMQQLGYMATVGAAGRALKRSLQRWHFRKGGRPSKVHNPFWIKEVKTALDTVSTASSWTCLGPDKKTRRQVRSLVTKPTTILRHGVY
ncbi:unnamed protein product [Symbiodinium sp. CCMP2592]|nr:unnamed protein product [Symbiodinium sp. CCMP2592]